MNRFTNVFALFAFITLTACGTNYEVSTHLAANGTVRRTIVSDKDTTRSEHLSEYPIEWDESYTKHFRWFRTLWRYRAVCPPTATQSLPVREFMSESDLAIWFSADSIPRGMNGFETSMFLADISRKFLKWAGWSYMDADRKIVSPYLSPSDSAMLQRDIEAICASMETLEDLSQDIAPKEFCAILDSFYVTSRFGEMYLSNAKEIDSLYNKMAECEYDALCTEYLHSVSMPGKVVSTNGYSQCDGTLRWKIDGFRTLPGPVVMEAESLRVNWWAYVLTAILVAVAIYPIAIRVRK